MAGCRRAFSLDGLRRIALAMRFDELITYHYIWRHRHVIFWPRRCCVRYYALVACVGSKHCFEHFIEPLFHAMPTASDINGAQILKQLATFILFGRWLQRVELGRLFTAPSENRGDGDGRGGHQYCALIYADRAHKGVAWGIFCRMRYIFIMSGIRSKHQRLPARAARFFISLAHGKY